MQRNLFKIFKILRIMKNIILKYYFRIIVTNYIIVLK